MVDQAPPADEVFPELLEFIGNDYLVAHNASFDEKFCSLKRRIFGRHQDIAARFVQSNWRRGARSGLVIVFLSPLAYINWGIKFNGRARQGGGRCGSHRSFNATFADRLFAITN